MAISVFTNVGSLNAQRNLSSASQGLNNTLQRLSSGLRINSAADDAAGLAISTGLQSQVRGLNQAIRNAGDGLSLLGTAEAGIAEQTNLLQRVRELAVQSANDTNTASNRASLNDEATALKNELDRIAQTVSFNGQNLLDGTFSSKDIQVGSESGASQRIAVSVDSTRASAIGQFYSSGTSSAVTTGTAADAGDITITIAGVTTNVGATASDGISTTNATSSAISFANAINSAGTEVSAAIGGATGEGTNSQAAATVAGDGTDYVKINGINVGAFTTTSATSSEAIDAINSVSGQTGVTATRTSTNKITLSNTSGANIQVEVGGTGATGSGLVDGQEFSGTVTLSSSSAFSVGGADVANLNLGSTTASQTSDNVQTLSIATKDDANKAIETIDAALNTLNERRAGIGAQVNRLNSTISSLSAISENVSASNSRIQDADFAAETANLTRTQILQQAATSVLAQANQTPQLALSLLR